MSLRLLVHQSTFAVPSVPHIFVSPVRVAGKGCRTEERLGRFSLLTFSLVIDKVGTGNDKNKMSNCHAPMSRTLTSSHRSDIFNSVRASNCLLDNCRQCTFNSLLSTLQLPFITTYQYVDLWAIRGLNLHHTHMELQNSKYGARRALNFRSFI